MSFTEFPYELKQPIFNALSPEIFQLSDNLTLPSRQAYLIQKVIQLPIEKIKECCSTHIALSNTCKQLNEDCLNYVSLFQEVFKIINMIKNKYSSYTDLYNTLLKEKKEYDQSAHLEKLPSHWFQCRPFFGENSVPYLLDAVLSGFPSNVLDNAKPSLDAFTDEVGYDIELILNLFPQSVHCDIESAHSHPRLAPLTALYINHKQIPDKNTFFYLVELLLKKGANPNYTHLSNKTLIDLIRFASLNFQPAFHIEYEGEIHNDEMIELIRFYGGKTNAELVKEKESSSYSVTGRHFLQKKLPPKKRVKRDTRRP